MSKVGVVILNWNGVGFLEKFLPTLIKYTPADLAEIIIADNHSSDASMEFMKKEHPGIRCIEMDKNHGFAGGYNIALQNLDHEYFLILNSDIEVTQNWIEPLVSTLEQNEEFAACAPLLINFEDREQYEYAGAAGGFIDKYGYTFCRGRLFNTCEKADLTMKSPLEVFWTTGACMLVRSSQFRAAGGFDPAFFAHMEEVDLCWRFKNRGLKLAIVPESRVYHVGGGTLPKSNPFKTYLNFRNNLLLLYKNLPEKDLERILFRRKLLDGLSALLFLSQFKFKDFAAIFTAHRHFNKMKKDYSSFRKENKRMKNHPEHDEIYNRSIVKDYFISGRKTFMELRDDFGKRMNDKLVK